MPEVTISPITRLSGLLSVEISLDQAGVVREANCVGELFRGYEMILRGRQVTDAVYLTQRVCGICSLAHGYTAARLAEKIYGAAPTSEMILLQQAMYGAEFLQNHLRHFYLLALPDYLDGDPSLGADSAVARAGPERSRFSAVQQRVLVDHYFAAIEFSRKCHDMLAVFAGKIPHQHGLTPEGAAVAPTADRRLQFLALLAEARSFIAETMLPDARLLASVYPDCYSLGAGPGRYLSFGLFAPAAGGHFPGGALDDRGLQPVNQAEIAEGIAFSWFAREGAVIVPQPEKPAAYTWVKAARYRGLPYECGPLARKFIRAGRVLPAEGGVMGRLVARAEEAYQIACWMQDWVEDLPAAGRYVVPHTAPVLAQAVQANDAPRGALLHAVSAEGSAILDYTIITPSTWNFSPKDEAGRRGPAEEALVGAIVPDPEDPVAVGRIVRSFDPCLTCATHLLDWRGRNLTSVKIG